MPRPLGRSRGLFVGVPPPPPTVSSVAPPGGGSGASIVITGTHFLVPPVTAVAFVSSAGVATPAASFVIDSDGQITATTPVLAPDLYTIRVTGPGGWTTLGFDWWQTPDYPGAGVVWPGTPSGGPSGAAGNLVSAGAAGAPINGHVPLRLAGGASSQGALTLDNYITTTAIYGAVVFNSATLPPDNGAASRFLNAQLVCCQPSALFGFDISTAGVGYWILSSFVAYVEDAVPCPLGALHALQFKYDGSFASCRLDAGAWTAGKAVVPGFNGISLATQAIRFGTPTYANQNPTADVAEGFLTSTALTLADFDHYLAYARAKYGF